MREQELSHHGIKGQKWGVRRYQNEDGTLTTAGKKRASYTDSLLSKDGYRGAGNKSSESVRGNSSSSKSSGMTDAQKDALKKAAIGVAATATVAAAAYAYSKNKDTVDSVISNARNKVVQAGSVASAKAKETASKGRAELKRQAGEVKSNAKTAIKNAPKTLGNAAVEGAKKGTQQVVEKVVQGAAIGITMKALDQMITPEKRQEYIDNYNAFNKKNKIKKQNQSNDDDD